MILLMVVMMMMLMTMMMTIVAHTYTDWQVGASCVERELPPEATCHLVPRGKKANWTEKAWFRQIWGGFMKRWWSSQSWGCWDLWEKWRSALMTVWKRHKVEVDTSPARVRGSRCRAFSQKHTILLLLNVLSRYTCGRNTGCLKKKWPTGLIINLPWSFD